MANKDSFVYLLNLNQVSISVCSITASQYFYIIVIYLSEGLRLRQQTLFTGRWENPPYTVADARHAWTDRRNLSSERHYAL